MQPDELCVCGKREALPPHPCGMYAGSGFTDPRACKCCQVCTDHCHSDNDVCNPETCREQPIRLTAPPPAP